MTLLTKVIAAVAFWPFWAVLYVLLPWWLADMGAFCYAALLLTAEVEQ